MSQALTEPRDKILSLRLQQAVGSLGALLALVILGASILLRLTTHMTDDGTVHSTLPTATENAVRMVHRLTASGVGLLALLATVLCWMRRISSQTVKPVVWLVLVICSACCHRSVDSRLLRYTLVTVTNVVGGTVLLGACWWLREALSSGATPHPTKTTIACFESPWSFWRCTSHWAPLPVVWKCVASIGSSLSTLDQPC